MDVANLIWINSLGDSFSMICRHFVRVTLVLKIISEYLILFIKPIILPKKELKDIKPYLSNMVLHWAEVMSHGCQVMSLWL